MTQYTDEDRIIALAGIFQATALVRDIAHTGQYQNHYAEISLASLFMFDAASVAAVFGSARGVEYGLKVLHTQLESTQKRDMEVARYTVSLVHLADQLNQDDTSLDTIADSLGILQTNKKNFNWSMATYSAQLAEIYQQHISIIQPQIMVHGEPAYLQSNDNATLIRGLLFAGVRAAILWRQCGGKKPHLLFSRRKIAAAAKALLDGFNPKM